MFYFVFEGNFQVQARRGGGGGGGAYIWRGDLTERFLRYEFGGLIFGGAYTWRILFSEFYGISHSLIISKESKHMLINDKSQGLCGNFYFLPLIILIS